MLFAPLGRVSMEAVFKKQFWVVTLAFLAGNAYLLARGSNQLLAYFIAEKIAASAAAAAPAAAAAKPAAAKVVRAGK